MTDAAGDPRPFTGIVEPILRDLVSAAFDVNAGIVTLTLAFATGTSLAPDVVATVHLDTDESRATGAQSSTSDTAWIGGDYAIFFANTRASGRADIVRWAQSAFVPAGTADVSYPSTDQVRIAFPLSVLDNDDGRFAFKMWAGAKTAGGTGAVDFMPDLGASPGLTR